MTEHRIDMQPEDIIELVLPSGHVFIVHLNDTDDESLPELDMFFQDESVVLMANCFLPHLVPAVADKDYQNCMEVNQILIPVPRKSA